MENISLELGREIRRVGEQTGSDTMGLKEPDKYITYGFTDAFIVRDSKKGIHLEYSIIKMKRSGKFTPGFIAKLEEVKKEKGTFCINEVDYTRGLVGG